jgi:tetratricopeptide (TPR) repeat protein
MLHARALALSSRPSEARDRYKDAAGLATGADQVEVAIDWASFELANDPVMAMQRLEAVSTVSADREQAERYRVALATARHAAGVFQLRNDSGNVAKAVERLAAGASAGLRVDLSLRCDYALAVVAAQDRSAAKVIRDISKQPCPFAAWSDGLALPILAAVVSGQQPGRAAAALATLTAMSPRSAAAKDLLGKAIRVVAVAAADEAYRGGHLKEARRLLRRAAATPGSIGDNELAHNLAVLDLAEANFGDAMMVFKRLDALPEAQVNLGLVYDQQRKADLALDTWIKAKDRGAKFAPLAGWIKAKQAILGRP